MWNECGIFCVCMYTCVICLHTCDMSMFMHMNAYGIQGGLCAYMDLCGMCVCVYIFMCVVWAYVYGIHVLYLCMCVECVVCACVVYVYICMRVVCGIFSLAVMREGSHC